MYDSAHEGRHFSSVEPRFAVKQGSVSLLAEVSPMAQIHMRSLAIIGAASLRGPAVVRVHPESSGGGEGNRGECCPSTAGRRVLFRNAFPTRGICLKYSEQSLPWIALPVSKGLSIEELLEGIETLKLAPGPFKGQINAAVKPRAG